MISPKHTKGEVLYYFKVIAEFNNIRYTYWWESAYKISRNGVFYLDNEQLCIKSLPQVPGA